MRLRWFYTLHNQETSLMYEPKGKASKSALGASSELF